MILHKPTFSVLRDIRTGAVLLLDGLPAIRTNGELRFVDADGTERVVPPSFVGNGGSTPRSLRWFLHPHSEAAIHAFHLHDYDYADPAVSRWRADARLFSTLRCGGVALFVATCAWVAVRLGGGSHRACVGGLEISWHGLRRRTSPRTIPLALIALAGFLLQGCETPHAQTTAPAVTVAASNAVATATDTAAASLAEVKKILETLPHDGVTLTSAARLALDGHLAVLEATLGKPSVKAAEAAALLTALADTAKFRQAAIDAEAGRRRAEEALQAAQSEALRLREERDQARKDKESEARAWRDRAFYAAAATIALAGVAAIALGIYLTRRRLTVVGAALLPCSAVVGWIPQLLESEAFLRVQTAVAYAGGAVLVGLIGFAAYEVVKWLRSAKAVQVATVVGTAVKAAS